MITAVKLVKITISSLFVCVMRALEIYSISKFPVYNIVLLSITIVLYIRPLDVLILYSCNFMPFDQHVV